MLNIIGSYECKVDAKGRFKLPTKLKKQLIKLIENGFVIKRSVFHKCLELYPMVEWDKEVEGVNKLNRFVKKNNDFIRMFMAGVRVVETDSTDRVQIPKDLINFSGINKQIVLSSAVNRVEIWDKDLYEKVITNPEVDFGQLAEEVMGGISQNDEEDK